MLDGGEISEREERVLLLNNAIFFKSEFAKQSFRIIESCYKKYAHVLDDGRIIVKPRELLPAIKEIDSLLFELGSILDFFAREINIAFNLSIGLKNVKFSSVVRKCKDEHADEPITEALLRFDNLGSHRYFRKMRNRITHRLPLVMKGKNDQIFFPDDPNSDDVLPHTADEIDVLKACNEWLHEILAFVNQTSIIVFQKLARYNAYNNETGEIIDIEKFFKRE